MGKFLVKNAANGFKFGLIVANDEIILNSEIYSSEAACLAGIESVKKNALIAKIEDLAIAGARKTAATASELTFELKAQYAAHKMINDIETPEEIREKALIARRAEEILIERLRAQIIHDIEKGG